MENEEDEKIGVPCEHDETHPDKSIWVKPSPSERIHSPAQRRPYCKYCGRIKYTGSARAKKMGFYINVLKELQRKVEVLYRRKRTNHRLTKVQIRLILKELESDEDFRDRFSNNRYNQWIHFKEVVGHYCGIDEELMEQVLRELKG